MMHVIGCICRRKFYIQSLYIQLTYSLNLLWSWLVLIENPESTMSETKTRPRKNVFNFRDKTETFKKLSWDQSQDQDQSPILQR